MGQAEQLDPGVVDQLQRVFAVEGKQRRMHDFKNAGQQGCGLERTDALLLQQVGESIDLGGQFAKRVLRAGPARAEGVIALAQRRHHVGERLQRADHALNQSARQPARDKAAGSRRAGVRARDRCDAGKEQRRPETSAGSASSRQ